MTKRERAQMLRMTKAELVAEIEHHNDNILRANDERHEERERDRPMLETGRAYSDAKEAAAAAVLGAQAAALHAYNNTAAPEPKAGQMVHSPWTLAADTVAKLQRLADAIEDAYVEAFGHRPSTGRDMYDRFHRPILRSPASRHHRAIRKES